jgi:hypothetical protein
VHRLPAHAKPTLLQGQTWRRFRQAGFSRQGPFRPGGGSPAKTGHSSLNIVFGHVSFRVYNNKKHQKTEEINKTHKLDIMVLFIFSVFMFFS